MYCSILASILICSTGLLLGASISSSLLSVEVVSCCSSSASFFALTFFAISTISVSLFGCGIPADNGGGIIGISVFGTGAGILPVGVKNSLVSPCSSKNNLLLSFGVFSPLGDFVSSGSGSGSGTLKGVLIAVLIASISALPFASIGLLGLGRGAGTDGVGVGLLLLLVADK